MYLKNLGTERIKKLVFYSEVTRVFFPKGRYLHRITEIELFEQLDRHFDERAAAKEPTELFTKNIGLC